jgi:hypothetical protein
MKTYTSLSWFMKISALPINGEHAVTLTWRPVRAVEQEQPERDETPLRKVQHPWREETNSWRPRKGGEWSDLAGERWLKEDKFQHKGEDGRRRERMRRVID